ncbi:MAG: hypothetical protein QW231_05165 [Candidatus Bathyarchaeia archaeon]
MRRYWASMIFLSSIIILALIMKFYMAPAPIQPNGAKTTVAHSIQTITIRSTQATQTMRGVRSTVTEPSKKFGPNLLPNPGFEIIVKNDDEFSDINGNRPFPWGFEVLSGNPICISNSSLAYGGRFSVKIIGNSSEDSVLLAIPEYALKPRISPGKIYRLEAWVKFEGLEGPGVRLIQQFFNRSYFWYPEHQIYGPWHKGSSDWTKLVLDARTFDIDNVVGDPVVEFSGEGTLWVDDISFYEVEEVG